MAYKDLALHYFSDFLPYQSLLGRFASATLDSLLSLEHIKHASGPWHLPFPLSRIVFPSDIQITALSIGFLLKCHLIREVT